MPVDRFTSGTSEVDDSVCSPFAHRPDGVGQARHRRSWFALGGGDELYPFKLTYPEAVLLHPG